MWSHDKYATLIIKNSRIQSYVMYRLEFPCSCKSSVRLLSVATRSSITESSCTHKVSKKSRRAGAGTLLVEATTVHAPAVISAETRVGSPHKSSTLTHEQDNTTTTQRDRSNAEKSRDAKIPSASCIPASAAGPSHPATFVPPPTPLPEKCMIFGRCFKKLTAKA